jgi:archaemetzincin
MIRHAVAWTVLSSATPVHARTLPALPPGLEFIPAEMRALGPAAGPIDLYPVGRVAATRLTFLCGIVAEVFGARCRTHAPLPVPDIAWSPARQQLDADAMLALLANRFPADASRVLAVSELDLAAVARPYVFGYGHLRDRVAILSIARLLEEHYGRAPREDLVLRRLYKAAVHELGHTAGNPHCTQPSCVMREVADLDALDTLPMHYCTSCRTRMQQELRVSRQPPEPSGRAILRGMVAGCQQATPESPTEIEAGRSSRR